MRVFISENPELARHAHCFVNGVDVSRRCYGADDDLGEAHCYIEDAQGMTAVAHRADCNGLNCTLGDDLPEGCHMLTEVLRGDVRIEIPEAVMSRYLDRLQE